MSLTFALLLSQQFSFSVISLADSESSFVGCERIIHYFGNELEDKDKKNQIQIDPTYSDYALCFENVSLSYEEDEGKDEGKDSNEIFIKKKKVMALKNINISIKKGEKVAIIGRTGSGKSSLIMSLARMYDIEEGKIIMNGINIKDLTLKELRSKISIIPQFGFLFAGSLSENVSPDKKIAENQINEFIHKNKLEFSKGNSNDKKDIDPLSIDIDPISNFNNFKIEEAGSNLSNGEKQMINILRVLMGNNQIICLDEANSNLDPDSDKKINELIFNNCKDKTLIMITHRLDNIGKFNRVFELVKGELKELQNVKNQEL